MQKEIDYSKRTSLDEIPEDFFKISSGICICIRLIDIDYNEYLNNSDYKNLVVNLPYCTDWIRLRCLNWEEKQTITLVFECLHEETDPPSGTQVLIEQFREKTQVDIFLGHKDRLAFGVFQLTFISEINVICNLLKDNLSLNMLLDKISAPELVSTEDLFPLNQYVISGGPGVEKDIKPISRESFVFDEYRIELYNQSLLDGLGFFLTYSNLDFYESFIRGEVEFQKFLSDHTEIKANSAFSLIYAICFGTCKRYTPLFIKQMQHAINHEPEIPCLKQGDYIS